jgi:hypothetical protein
LCKFREFTVKCYIAANWWELRGRDVAGEIRGAYTRKQRNE